MAICKDCIAAGVKAPAAATLPCDGLTFTLADVNGRTETSVAYVKDNALSLIGYDIFFDFGGVPYSVVYSAPNWLILDKNGIKVWASSATGTNNNSCPPKSGWSDISSGRIFSSVGVDYILAPGPSNDCLTTNGTFDTNATGWTVSNLTWNTALGGSLRYDSVLLGSLAQNILEIGETYEITLDYSASATRVACTPAQYNAAFIKVYAGTNVYSFPLDNTVNDVGTVRSISATLTCKTNTTFKVEIQDPNQCYATVTGFKGSFIDNVCVVKTTNVTDPVGEPSPLPSVAYKDMAEVPAQVFGTDFNTLLQSYQECLAIKGTTLYNKIVGAVRCDDRELQKLKLIIGLLSQKNEDRALDCIYDRENVITAIYPNLPTGNLPVLVEGQTTIVIDGDLSQFETFIFHIEAVTDYAVLEGSIVINTTVSAIYIPSGGLPFLILGYSFSLLNNLGNYYATPATNVVANILYTQPGPPVNNTIIPSGTISTFALFTVANGTTWALYAPVTASTIPVDFTTTIVDAVYNAATNKTTIIIQDPLPGTIGAATYAIEFAAENDNTYLKTFTDFASRFCANCILTGPTPTPTAPTTPSLGLRTSSLVGESGVPITTEFNQQITI